MASVQRRIVHKQFNSPIAMYSDTNVKETLNRELKVLSSGAVGWVWILKNFILGFWVCLSVCLYTKQQKSYWILLQKIWHDHDFKKIIYWKLFKF